MAYQMRSKAQIKRDYIEAKKEYHAAGVAFAGGRTTRAKYLAAKRKYHQAGDTLAAAV